jgi:hypothetical protein
MESADLVVVAEEEADLHHHHIRAQVSLELNQFGVIVASIDQEEVVAHSINF